MKYHVSKKGHDENKGTLNQPFLTISKAAEIAAEGDIVIVHEGVYRETVNLYKTARTGNGQIVFEAAKNESVIIKGSEQIKNWEITSENLWCAKIENGLFGEYNPYSEPIDGDWLMDPYDPPLHTGQVYINGKALSEVQSGDVPGAMQWYAVVNESTTRIYANFDAADPNKECIEINVRESCFKAAETGVNYITIRGFELAQAATKWSPPTSEQSGLICANWCKGWIIEDNIIHDARCSAVCIGKERSTGHNLSYRYGRKPGYQTQLECVFAGIRMGWSKERVGSHIIRHNLIYNCGQNAVVGNMGGAFSEVCNNHIYNIGNLHKFFGYEIAGIKLHAAIDTHIHHNRIHNCLLGIWLDWQAQGARVSSNLCYNNETDIWIEVTHGPHLVDNNIFASEETLRNAAQGGAYIHNLFCGRLSRYDVTNRSTPYHLPHSTEVMGTAVVYGGDDRFYQNIFIGNPGKTDNNEKYGTEHYIGYCASIEEYTEKVRANGRGDVEKFMKEYQPVYINNNVYLKGAAHYDREENFCSDKHNCRWRIREDGDKVYLDIDFPENAFLSNTQIISTDSMVPPRISEEPYESPEGNTIVLNTDFLGQKRSNDPKPGPIEILCGGEQIICLR